LGLSGLVVGKEQNMDTEPDVFSLGGESGRLYLSDEAFKPNLTTKLLAEAVEVQEGDSVLELGCGVGPLSIYAARKGAAKVIAVDIMPQACECARRNVELNGVADRVEVRNGSLFEPVQGMKFDVIIDDVSGMSEEIARISPWYPDTIPAGGADGTEQTVEMLEQASDYLNDKGQLYFPVISLSNWRKTLDLARNLFGSTVELVSQKHIPFCEEFKEAMPELERLKELNLIDFVRKRSRYVWDLSIYRAARNS